MRRPEFVSDVLQIVKGVLAATIAWWLAVTVLDSEVLFLAPWTALLTVYPTVYQSLSHGVQTTVASWLGIGLAFVVGLSLGVDVWTFALTVFIGLLASRIRGIRAEGLTIPVAALFVLISGFSGEQPVFLDRILEVLLGAVVGMAVNMLLIPPLRDRQAARYVDHINHRMGRMLIEMSDEFSSSWDTDRAEAWFSETESMSEDLDAAWAAVLSARESRRANLRVSLPVPRRALHRRQESPQAGDQASYADILRRLDEGILHLRHLARTLREASYSQSEWDRRFREQWVAIVRDAGRAIADPKAPVEPLYDRVVQFASQLSDEDELPRSTWPLYGSLITSLRHIVVIVDDVASAKEAREATSSNPGM